MSAASYQLLFHERDLRDSCRSLYGRASCSRNAFGTNLMTGQTTDDIADDRIPHPPTLLTSEIDDDKPAAEGAAAEADAPETPKESKEGKKSQAEKKAEQPEVSKKTE